MLVGDAFFDRRAPFFAAYVILSKCALIALYITLPVMGRTTNRADNNIVCLCKPFAAHRALDA